MAKIGIMGGTFDPVHVGHLILAEYALNEAGLDEVWLLPTGISYMKKDRGVTSAQDRLQMVKLSIQAAGSKLGVSDIEIRREGYTYTFETIEELKKNYPQHEFSLIYGADCLFDFEKWKNPQRIFDGCRILIAARNDSNEELMMQKKQELCEKYNAKIDIMPFIRMELSSSLVRQRVAEGKSIRYMVTDSVLQYIEEKGLYKG